MWKKELLKNKLYALLLVIIGALSILIEYDVTFFIFALMIVLPLFFAKENGLCKEAVRHAKLKK